MKTFNFHLYHISFLDSLFNGLVDAGVSVDRLLNKGMIKRFDVWNPATYLPINVYYEFIDRVKKEQGIDHVSGEFYGRFQLGDLSDFGKFLTHCPDMLSILQNGIKYNYQVQTNGKLELKINGGYSEFSMNHIDPPSGERLISEKIEMAMMLKAFIYNLGPDWRPLEIHLSNNDGQWLESLFPSLDFSIYTNRPRMVIVFKTEELAVRNTDHTHNYKIEEKPILTPKGAISYILQSMNEGYIPTLDDLSVFFGCSRRTILRKISEVGMSYHGLLQKHLFIRSIDLLKNHHITVETIAAMLGYANAPNFIRAFKNWTSVTPDQYRNQTLFCNLQVTN